MSDESENLPPPGDLVCQEGLCSSKGQAFATALAAIQTRGFVELVELRRIAEPASDVIVFNIEPERPQHLKNDIRRVETIAAVFRDDEVTYPEVLALRANFPSVPHINLRHEEYPRSLCLYDQPWSDERSKWTPTSFLQRIHIWLSKTADGSLHASDQPLEPMMFGTNALLIVPPEIVRDPATEVSRPLILTHYVDQLNHLTVVAEWLKPQLKVAHDWICLSVKCPPSTHGVIRRIPCNLTDLHSICARAGFDLLDEIGSRIRNWLVNPPYENYQASKLLVIVLLPKTRHEGGDVESVETRAFLTFNHSVRNIGDALDITDGKSSIAGGVAGLILNPQKPNPNKFSSFDLQPVEISTFLDPETAAVINGRDRIEKKMLAIGAGAFGSQVLSNMVRAGSDNWTVVDHDIIKPHNSARHLLGAECVGHNKAIAVSHVLSKAINPWNPPIRAIPTDFLNSIQDSDLRQATIDTELIFDFSASVAVARHLSSIESLARRISSFVTPSGSGLVILVEDAKRTCTLDWLENIHYRLILTRPMLRDSLYAPGRIRTGATCRDMSFIIGQAELVTWAGMFSQKITGILENTHASVHVFLSSTDGAITPVLLEPDAPTCFRLGDWDILFDRWLIERLEGFRSQRLPNETGGILLGVLDTEKKTCLLTDALPSPPDSTEWPTSYIRGCKGLLSKMKDVENQTAGQVTYVGEWHSHPDGAGVRPSVLDRQAFENMKIQRNEECLPTLMLIVGKDHQFRFVRESSTKKKPQP